MHDQAPLPLDDRYEIRINAFLPASNNHLFNEADYFRLHATSDRDRYAQLVRISDQRVCATMALHAMDDHVFASPRAGTFGGLCINHPVDIETLERFFDVLLAHLKSLGARTIKVKLAPLSHDLPLLSTVTNCLLQRGAAVATHDLNFDMRVDERDFIDRVDTGNAKRIRKCLREGFVADTPDIAELGAAYALIRDNRNRRGFPLSMTLGQLETMAVTFPERMHLFAVFAEASRARMVAAAICLAVSPAVLYVFYWGDADDVASHSPIALLASRIYEFCQQRSFALLDAGTATVDGVPNHGLVRFKQNLGFAASLKLSVSCPI